ncbi:response regulator transcription factor [Endozoicomonas sp. G2_2]|uniref:LytR/AlgR family response regulator transcription factor n=1 Tax=Endozoicomonas sp. G2_2 TaxID=2821092 RepID=UPI001ADA2AAE|nr:LytTR family DNA-binding domain-containing protein [Endozoicomonas sp. G2_2]MBO9468868.1 response regulator transcription factor [Endozoicomonas sp. G2_2]
MKIVIVDDEPLARERLRRMIEPFPGYEVVGEAGDGESALRCLHNTAADTVLLDVHMPGMDGLQVARALAESDVPPAVIFITAHSEHALSAHNSHAAGYLLKPVRRDDLAAALSRARRPSRAQLAALEDNASTDRPAFVSARTRDGIERVAVADILYFWADQKYTTVYHMQGELLIEQSLLTLEQSLGGAFMRVHRKALVACRHITGLRLDGPDGASLTLRHVRDGVPVSRRRLADVRALLEK